MGVGEELFNEKEPDKNVICNSAANIGNWNETRYIFNEIWSDIKKITQDKIVLFSGKPF
jgi:hypothetical protein